MFIEYYNALPSGTVTFKFNGYTVTFALNDVKRIEGAEGDVLLRNYPGNFRRTNSAGSSGAAVTPTAVEPQTLTSANVGTFAVTTPNQSGYYIDVNTSGGNVTLTNAALGTYAAGTNLIFRKVSTDTNKLIYNDGLTQYDYLDRKGETLSVERTGTKYLVK